ncbi:hypothetical protein CBOM_07355 [Ceraceosorus bombacis]|uniref:Uncharacterized protein n=1 Tax=Ceraceosorus bombacis TaxID=401625 RepID=A0A0P1BA85_9BASI|nr:hypothetical protein CBOM_07355 [Ceraceosorus bombacis]
MPISPRKATLAYVASGALAAVGASQHAHEALCNDTSRLCLQRGNSDQRETHVSPRS